MNDVLFYNVSDTMEVIFILIFMSRTIRKAEVGVIESVIRLVVANSFWSIHMIKVTKNFVNTGAMYRPEVYAMVVWTFIAIIFVIGVGRAALSNNMETGNEEEK